MIFYKLSSLGNNFIVIDDALALSKKKIRELCSLEKGIGADGILLINEEKGMIPLVRIYNKDGSEAKMCGNGLKIISYYYKNIAQRVELPREVMTKSGKKIIGYEGIEYYVEVPWPKFRKKIQIGKEEWWSFQTGNNHVLKIVSSISKAMLIDDVMKYRLGEMNVSYLKKENERRYEILTYERGVGITASCGSAALSAYALLRKLGCQYQTLHISCPGGVHKIAERDGVLRLSSTVTYCYRGEYYGY